MISNLGAKNLSEVRANSDIAQRVLAVREQKSRLADTNQNDDSDSDCYNTVSFWYNYWSNGYTTPN